MPTLDWNVRECIMKCSPNNGNNKLPKENEQMQFSKSNIMFEDIVHAYELLASIVTEHGGRFLPIFERLHKEIEEHRSRSKLLKIAKNITLSTDNIT